MKKTFYFILFFSFFILFVVSFTALVCPHCLIGGSYVSAFLGLSTLGYTSATITGTLALIFLMLGLVQDTIDHNTVTNPRRKLFKTLEPAHTITIGVALFAFIYLLFGKVTNLLSSNALVLLYTGSILVVLFGFVGAIKK